MTISSDILAAIRAHAAASPGLEVCGLLFGDERTVTDARRCLNVASDPATRFELDPAALLAAHRLARRGGPRIAGHYHSHPTGLASPSPRDAEGAVPDGSLWLVTAAGNIGVWRAVASGCVLGRFDPVTLLVPSRAMSRVEVDDDTPAML